jgi:hypothetical protein
MEDHIDPEAKVATKTGASSSVQPCLDAKATPEKKLAEQSKLDIHMEPQGDLEKSGATVPDSDLICEPGSTGTGLISANQEPALLGTNKVAPGPGEVVTQPGADSLQIGQQHSLSKKQEVSLLKKHIFFVTETSVRLARVFVPDKIFSLV